MGPVLYCQDSPLSSGQSYRSAARKSGVRADTRESRMRRLTATLVALLSLLLFAMPASAGWEWCESDPVLLLEGRRGEVPVAVPQDALARVDRPVGLVVPVA